MTTIIRSNSNTILSSFFQYKQDRKPFEKTNMNKPAKQRTVTVQ